MNLKKISVSPLLFLLLGGFGILATSNVFATIFPVSDIDLYESSIQITFDDEADTDNRNQFECFGESGGTDAIRQVTKSFSDLNLNLDKTNIDATILLADETKCFQQAGDYEIRLHLQDKAGNSTDQGPYYYQVKASNPASPPTLGVLTDCNSPLANNSDTCELSFVLKDRFENPVTQIDALTLNPNTSAFDDDTNSGTSFLDGLRLGPDAKTMSDAAISLSGANGVFPLIIKAIVPSIGAAGEHFSQLVARSLTFDTNVPLIQADGTIGASTIELSVNTAGLIFRNLFALEPSIDGFSWSGENETDGKITLTLTESDNTLAGRIGRQGSVVAQNSNLDFTPDTTLNAPYFLGSVIDLFTDESHPVEIPALISLRKDQSYDEDQQLALVTNISYQLEQGGPIISYPAGGAGMDNELLQDTNINIETVIGYNENAIIPIVGADIEGGIIGSLSQMEIQPKNESEMATFNVSQSTEKLRDQITENVYRLSRGSSNVRDGGNFDSGWFTNHNVVIVEVDGDDVIFPGGELPAGKNTLIIRNGNFIVSGDMSYTNNGDSFGVILMNDNQSSREDGNIFVKPTVKTIVGSYYADGGLMTVDNVPNPTIADANNIEDGNLTQLLLTGALFSQNTLGGSMITIDGNYITPWGPTDGNDPEDLQEARKYDLHYVRRYQPDLYPNNEIENDNIAQCVANPNGENGCDDNENAFVIRIDRKASVAPPPGFESAGSIIR